MAKPVTCVIGEFGETIVAGLPTTVHTPVAGNVTGLPSRVMELPADVQTFWFGPAAATALFGS